MENSNGQSILLIIITLLLTYSFPKLIEYWTKKGGDSKGTIDTQNIKNALILYEEMYKQKVALEKKCAELDIKHEKLKDEINRLEEKHYYLHREKKHLEELLNSMGVETVKEEEKE